MSSIATSNIDLYSFDLNDKSLNLLQSAIDSHYDQSVKNTPKRAGRKPLQETPELKEGSLDPKQKRKAQNRAAQRAFRDRKEKHVAELQARIAELEALNATKDETLVKENQELKERLKKLQEENYALKGAQFTFQFPLPQNDYHTPPASSHSSSSSSSGAEDGLSSAEQTSPSFNNDTPSSTSAEPVQFGLVGDNLYSQSLGNDLLIHGKDDLFADYHTTNDEFLFPNLDLSSLFGEADLFGMNMAQQFGLPQVPTVLDKKKMWLEKLKKAKAEGKYLYEVHQEFKQEVPDFDLELLCADMMKKAQCSVANHRVTDKDINELTRCIESVDETLF
ncbi:hypothetical protein G6F22_004407 [Rhizopus arrhizus]|nr:hypothetical protein G6F24_010623 [Rhizopus arrhizus]KAG0787146.1 hypothetical protein G6F21_008104 [Rhizopus arrhizus]KAG0798252.1 hypothetical protein G6F22_004407 [Rhizopus arrhizus]KAG0809428.1 hypothetical protein G6F20_008785 [Rhizopus arrhizus]KAG0942267.1 hypothetical protein G6F32_008106 [Rhizopus arrhizus]